MLDLEERKYQENIINTYGGIPDCGFENCNNCDDNQIEECYAIASSNCNSEFAKLITVDMILKKNFGITYKNGGESYS